MLRIHVVRALLVSEFDILDHLPNKGCQRCQVCLNNCMCGHCKQKICHDFGDLGGFLLCNCITLFVYQVIFHLSILLLHASLNLFKIYYNVSMF